MRYSLLLPRSVDFDEFKAILYPSYPDELSRPLILSLIQMLWDRGEPNGYAHRMTGKPLAHTPQHRVLINVALGDHQVTNFASDVEARTIGASAHVPILDPGRWPNVDVLFGVPPITQLPVHGAVGDLLLGHRPGPARSRQPGPDDRRPPAAAREPAEPRGGGPPRRPARRRAGRKADLGLPASERGGHRRLRRRGLPLRRLDGAVAMRRLRAIAAVLTTAAVLALGLAPTAGAQDPGRWLMTGASTIPSRTGRG